MGPIYERETVNYYECLLLARNVIRKKSTEDLSYLLLIESVIVAAVVVVVDVVVAAAAVVVVAAIAAAVVADKSLVAGRADYREHFVLHYDTDSSLVTRLGQQYYF